MANPTQYTAATLPEHVKPHTVSLPQADIAVFISTPDSTDSPHTPSSKPLICLSHGNSASSLVFRNIFNSPLAKTHTIVAYDLPGHGASSNVRESVEPDSVYTQHGYAQVAKGVLESELVRGGYEGVREVVFLGWSLGGHNGIELCEILEKEKDPKTAIVALLITGTPPVPLAGFYKGFYAPPPGSEPLLGVQNFTAEQASLFARGFVLDPWGEEWMHEAVKRTDGRARRIMFQSLLTGRFGVSDQKAAVERLTAEAPSSGAPRKGTWVVVVNGAREPYVDIRYIREEIQWGPGLWGGRCFEIPGAGHTPFVEAWEVFWGILERVVADVEA